MFLINSSKLSIQLYTFFLLYAKKKLYYLIKNKPNRGIGDN